MVMGLAVGLLLAGGGLVGYRKLAAPASARDTVAAPSVPSGSVEVAPPGALRSPDPVPSTPPPPPVVAAEPAEEKAAGANPPAEGDAAPVAGVAEGSTTQAPVTDKGKGSEDDDVKPLKPFPQKRRVTLGVGDITRIVERGSSRISSCFERNREDLPASTGQVQVEFSIASTGRVRASVRGPLADTKVGRCVRVQAERLRFPEHRDEEVNVLVPFAWTLK